MSCPEKRWKRSPSPVRLVHSEKKEFQVNSRSGAETALLQSSMTSQSGSLTLSLTFIQWLQNNQRGRRNKNTGSPDGTSQLGQLSTTRATVHVFQQAFGNDGGDDLGNRIFVNKDKRWKNWGKSVSQRSLKQLDLKAFERSARFD